MFIRTAFLLAISAILTGCATQTYAPEEAPEYSVIRDFASLYKLGPMQGRGPDATLRVGDRVKLIRKEMGYSFVLLEDSRTGYMANEDIVPAPPRPPQPAASASTGPAESTGRRGPSSPRYSGQQVNDIPLPESAPPPELDLNIGLEDIASPTDPPPSETPAEPPKFRY
ncbi:MAG: hypothetical protein WEB60_01855 [Terrimicrobiaceae bacterium]